MIKYFILALCVCLTSCSICRFKSAESIQAKLIKKTPLGMSREVAEPKIKKIAPILHNERRIIDQKISSKSNMIGPFILCGYLTGWIHTEGYEATWKFDGNNKLEKVIVDRWTDSL
jgi:hypothetical protein